MRRLVITICPRERGAVRLAVEHRGATERLDARAIVARLGALVAQRGLAARVRIQEGCAGGCAGPGPNVSVTMHARHGPGEREDHVAIGWKNYVASLATLPCLATIVEENLADPDMETTVSARRRRRSRGRRAGGRGTRAAR